MTPSHWLAPYARGRGLGVEINLIKDFTYFALARKAAHPCNPHFSATGSAYRGSPSPKPHVCLLQEWYTYSSSFRCGNDSPRHGASRSRILKELAKFSYAESLRTHHFDSRVPNRDAPIGDISTRDPLRVSCPRDEMAFRFKHNIAFATSRVWRLFRNIHPPPRVGIFRKRHCTVVRSSQASWPRI